MYQWRGSNDAKRLRGAFERLKTFRSLFVFVFVASVIVAFIQPAGAVSALDEPVEPPVIPAASFTFTSTPAEKTNQTTPMWQWQLTPSEGDAAAYVEFVATLKTADGTLVEERSGDATFLSYTPSVAVADGVYTLTVVVLAEPTLETVPTITHSIEVKTIPPVITDGGTNWDGSTATPGLEVTPGEPPVVPPVEPVDPIDPTEPTDPVEPVEPTDPELPVDETPEGEEVPVEEEPVTPPVPTYTYEWSTDAIAGLVTISDILALNPIITFHADGRASFTIRVTDAFGNIAEHTLRLSYLAPFIPGPSVPLVPEYTPPPLAPIVALAEVAPRVVAPAPVIDAPVPAAETGDIASGESTDAPLGPAQVATASTQGWLIFGAAWYWWLLGIGIIGSGVLWALTYRKNNPDDL